MQGYEPQPVAFPESSDTSQGLRQNRETSPSFPGAAGSTISTPSTTCGLPAAAAPLARAGRPRPGLGGVVAGGGCAVRGGSEAHGRLRSLNGTIMSSQQFD